MITRTEWGARAPKGDLNKLSATTEGCGGHWEGNIDADPSHATCDQDVRNIQNFHMDGRGWSDIAYNFLVCEHGYIYEGRGLGVGSAANGTNDSNLKYYAICALQSSDRKATPELFTGLAAAIDYCQHHGNAGSVVKGHRDFIATTCPGDELYAFLTGLNGTTPVVNPKPPTPTTTPGGDLFDAAPPFPLPQGAYFGPKEGPATSVSGYFSHRDDLKRWQTQMIKRGWNLGKAGADGLYGSDTAKVAHDFQTEKHLHVDALIGPDTWAAAWNLPIT